MPYDRLQLAHNLARLTILYYSQHVFEAPVLFSSDGKEKSRRRSEMRVLNIGGGVSIIPLESESRGPRLSRRMTLQVPSGRNGRLKIVRCPCCGEPLVFPSFKKAKVKAEELGYKTYRISRIAL